MTDSYTLCDSFTVSVNLDSFNTLHISTLPACFLYLYINKTIVREQCVKFRIVLTAGSVTSLLKGEQECVAMIMTFHCLLC